MSLSMTSTETMDAMDFPTKPDLSGLEVDKQIMFTKEGKTRPIREHVDIKAGRKFYKYPENVPIEESRTRRLHHQMRKHLVSNQDSMTYSKLLELHEYNDQIAKILIVACHQRSMQEAYILPSFRFENSIKYLMGADHCKTLLESFRFDPKDDGVSNLEINYCPFQANEKNKSLLAADQASNPGNITSNSIIVDDKKQEVLNDDTAKKIKTLLASQSPEDLREAIRLGRRSRIPKYPTIGKDHIRHAMYMENFYLKHRRMKAERPLVKIKGILRSTKIQVKDVAFMSINPPSSESFIELGQPFCGRFTSILKFDCNGKKDLNNYLISQKELNALFDNGVESERNFEHTIIDVIAVFMASIYWNDVKKGTKVLDTQSFQQFSHEFFGAENRTKLFGRSGNNYLQCTKLAVLYNDNGVRKLMPYVLFFRYLHVMLNKSINFEERKLSCLNGCLKDTRGNLSIPELSNHYTKNAACCVVCKICRKKFETAENVDQHFSTYHLRSRKGEYHHLIPLIEVKFEKLMKNQVADADFPFQALGNPLYHGWNTPIPKKYPCPLFSTEAARQEERKKENE